MRVIRIRNFGQGLQLKMRVIRIRNFSFRARLGNSLVKLIEVRVTLRDKKRRAVILKKVPNFKNMDYDVEFVHTLRY